MAERIVERTEQRIDNNPDKITASKIADKMKNNPWIISTMILSFIILVLLIVMIGKIGITGNVVSESDIGTKAVDFINVQLLQGQATVTLDSVSEKEGFYEVLVDFNGKIVPTYFTKNGYYIGNVLVSVNSITGNVVDNTSSQTQTAEIPKSDKPVVELYVMSFCPYGNKAEETMLPVYNLLKNKVDWNMNYIVSVSGDKISSLHGQPEVDQDIREVCVKKEYGLDKFWDFISYINNNCGSDGSCWETRAKQLGIDVNKIKTCFDNEGLTLMKTEAQISGEAGASGSPTLLINGVESSAVYRYGNSEAYKQAICSAFNTAPEECNSKLTDSSSAATSGGSC